MRPNTKEALDQLKGYIDALVDTQGDHGIPWEAIETIQKRLNLALLMEDPISEQVTP